VSVPISIKFTDVSYHIRTPPRKWYSFKRERRQILHGITDRVEPGQLVALMGPSGSGAHARARAGWARRPPRCGAERALLAAGAGKTTLLSVLGGRVSNTNDISGEILYNGQPATPKLRKCEAPKVRRAGAPRSLNLAVRRLASLSCVLAAVLGARRFVAFVLQDDVLFAHLTVRDTLRYAALLKLPRTMTTPQKMAAVRPGAGQAATHVAAQVENVIQLLHLERCANTKIGGPFARGVSGGERKRVSIGVEMLCNPSILLMDGAPAVGGGRRELTRWARLQSRPRVGAAARCSPARADARAPPVSSRQGLDSTVAYHLIRTLKDVAIKEHRTILCSIHQPSRWVVVVVLFMLWGPPERRLERPVSPLSRRPRPPAKSSFSSTSCCCWSTARSGLRARVAAAPDAHPGHVPRLRRRRRAVLHGAGVPDAGALQSRRLHQYAARTSPGGALNGSGGGAVTLMVEKRDIAERFATMMDADVKRLVLSEQAHVRGHGSAPAKSEQMLDFNNQSAYETSWVQQIVILTQRRRAPPPAAGSARC
jgi:ABC-type multidrug transport system ATPase subunit